MCFFNLRTRVRVFGSVVTGNTSTTCSSVRRLLPIAIVLGDESLFDHGSPFFKLFLAAQIKGNDKAFLSKDITVTDIILNRGDIHHVFPRNFLKKHGLPRGKYNQIANFAYTQTETNIKIRDREPKVYFGDVVEQTQGGELSYGAINDPAELKANLAANCIPEELHEMGLDRYDEFLAARRKLMAAKLKTYYSSL